MRSARALAGAAAGLLAGLALIAAVSTPRQQQPASAGADDEGRRVYDKWCAGCHGDQGKGDGDGARDIPEDQATDDYCDDPDNEWNYACLEKKFCDKPKKLNAYCEDHFDDADAPCIDNGVHPPADDADEEADLER